MRVLPLPLSAATAIRAAREAESCCHRRLGGAFSTTERGLLRAGQGGRSAHSTSSSSNTAFWFVMVSAANG
eukprot:6190732-Pleurochrysis_carterae.AAC.1